MPAYRVEYKPAANRDFERLPEQAQRRIVIAIDRLADNPRPRGAVKLSASDDIYRLRVGSYRIMYKVADEQSLVLIARIAHRKDAYRGM